MIAKSIKGRGFRGLLNYVFGEKKDERPTYQLHSFSDRAGTHTRYGLRNLSKCRLAHLAGESSSRVLSINARADRRSNFGLRWQQSERSQVIATNMAGSNPRQLAAEFGSIRKLKPSLSRAVAHVSLSASPGETLSDEQWISIANRYLDRMGFDDNQFIAVRHIDTDHEHIHIIVNRIKNNGDVVSDSNDFKRQEAVMREIERDFNLQTVVPSDESVRRAPSKGEVEKFVRTGEPSTKIRLQMLCDAATLDCTSFEQYQKRLKSTGVEVTTITQNAGSKLSGIMYKLNDVTMKASDLGKAYTPTGLAKKGICYGDKNKNGIDANRGVRSEQPTASIPEISSSHDRGNQKNEKGNQPTEKSNSPTSKPTNTNMEILDKEKKMIGNMDIQNEVFVPHGEDKPFTPSAKKQAWRDKKEKMRATIRQQSKPKSIAEPDWGVVDDGSSPFVKAAMQRSEELRKEMDEQDKNSLKAKIRFSRPSNPQKYLPPSDLHKRGLVEYWSEKSQKFWYYTPSPDDRSGEKTGIFFDPEENIVGWQPENKPEPIDCDRMIDIAISKFGEPVFIQGEFDFVQRVSARCHERGIKVEDAGGYDPTPEINDEDDDATPPSSRPKMR